MTADILIIGGGVVGSSVAYHLRRDGFTGRVVVVERDPSYARASSNLAMGGIRQQFGSAVNIRMAQYSIAFYREFNARMSTPARPVDARFTQRGYLFLIDAESAGRVEGRLERQRALGARAERLSVDEVRRLVPDLWLDDIVFGVMGSEDGYADPKAVLAGFRSGAEAAGAEYLTGEVVAIHRTEGWATGVTLDDGDEIDAGIVVNAAGPYASLVAEMAGVSIPVQPVRQHLFRCALPRVWPYRFPMVIDPGGVHWRHVDPVSPGDPDRLTLAFTKVDEPAGENFACDDSRWEREFLPALVRRMPVLKNARLPVEGWAGLYEMTPDHNPVIGEHPRLRGFYLANGFSGHGLMMAPATGKAVSELIRLERSETVDVSPFAADRFERDALVRDEAVI